MKIEKEEFLKEVLSAKANGKTAMQMARDIAKRYDADSASIYSRYYALLREVKKEWSTSKTRRKGQIKQILDNITLKVVYDRQVKVDTISMLSKLIFKPKR